MSRTSIPSMNKSGYSMFWNSMWDDKIHYNRFLKEDIFIKSFLGYFISDKPSIFLYSYKFCDEDDMLFLIEKYKLPIKVDAKGNLYKFLKSQNSLKFFLSKIWIIRYQQWVIIYFYTYTNSLSRLKHVSLSTNTNLTDNYDIFYNYYSNFYKLKFDNIYFNRSLKKRFIF